MKIEEKIFFVFVLKSISTFKAQGHGQHIAVWQHMAGHGQQHNPYGDPLAPNKPAEQQTSLIIITLYPNVTCSRKHCDI